MTGMHFVVWLLGRAVILVGFVVGVTSGVHAQDIARLELIWRDTSGKVLAREQLRLEDVRAMEMVSMTQRTPWTTQNDTYSGPLLSALASRAGLKVESATFFALNDYYYSMPEKDWQNNDVILAALKGGKPIPVDDKGPYWVMYSLIDAPMYFQQPYRSRMVWQIKRIEFLSAPK
jgi:hypothetical protein